MRAKEFVVEYKTEEYNGLRFTTDINNGQLIVRALDDWGTNELGHVVFNIGDQDELDPQDLEVDDRYQGQGIAKTMYDYVKTLGYEIHRSWDQTPAGAGFWNKHRGEERVWEDAGNIENFNGIQLSLEIQKDDEYVDDEDTDNQTVYVKATANGKELGHVLFTFDYDAQGQYLYPQDLEVEERFRGQGIAQTMYDYVKSKGYRIKRSGQQTDAGAGFWDKHRPEQNVWEDDVNEDISRRGFLQGVGAAAALGAGGAAQAKKPVPKPVATNPSAELLLKWAKKFITDPAELAAFMAQCAHESDNFRAMEEYGSPERFAKKYDIQYNPAKAKQLGNTQPGDGAKYRGRGYIQLTGKYNYQKASEWISKYLNHPVDFVKNPDLVSTPTAAALSSLWYWKTFVKPRTNSFANTKQVTKNINPGMRGQQNREQKARDWQAALNVKPIKPGKPVKVASR